MARDPGRFWGFVFVHAVRDRGRVREIVGRAALDWGFRGIKVHRRDAPLTPEVCDAARAFGLPVIYDIVDEVASVDEFARRYPDVAFVVPHLGSFADDAGAQSAFIERLAGHPNVLTDTSGVRHFDLMRRAVERCGAGKILFGTDGPWLHPGVELFKVRALGLPPVEEERVLGRNLLGLLGRAGRAPRGEAPGPAPVSASASVGVPGPGA